jgi:DNA-directed RNA polymerase subunit E'/Rpb7
MTLRYCNSLLGTEYALQKLQILANIENQNLDFITFSFEDELFHLLKKRLLTRQISPLHLIMQFQKHQNTAKLHQWKNKLDKVGYFSQTLLVKEKCIEQDVHFLISSKEKFLLVDIIKKDVPSLCAILSPLDQIKRRFVNVENMVSQQNFIKGTNVETKQCKIIYEINNECSIKLQHVVDDGIILFDALTNDFWDLSHQEIFLLKGFTIDEKKDIDFEKLLTCATVPTIMSIFQQLYETPCLLVFKEIQVPSQFLDKNLFDSVFKILRNTLNGKCFNQKDGYIIEVEKLDSLSTAHISRADFGNVVMTSFFARFLKPNLYKLYNGKTKFCSEPGIIVEIDALQNVKCQNLIPVENAVFNPQTKSVLFSCGCVISSGCPVIFQINHLALDKQTCNFICIGKHVCFFAGQQK